MEQQYLAGRLKGQKNFKSCNYIRQYICDNPILECARVFFSITEGKRAERIDNYYKVILDDNTIVVLRFLTKTESPAITISNKFSQNSKFKNQKVHFQKG